MLTDDVVDQAATANGYVADGRPALRLWVAAKGAAYRPSWSDARVRLAAEQLVMLSAGIDVGAADGIEGVRTQHGWEIWQDRTRPAAKCPAPPAFCRQADADAYYGAPGTNHVRIVPPYPIFYGEQPMPRLLINERCAESATRAMTRVLEHYGPQRIKRLGLDRYGGCFNDRPMRGGTAKSMHAYACAIDWDPVRNPLRADHRTAIFAGRDYRYFLDAWEAEGWTSLGRARDYDWMHVQAASL